MATERIGAFKRILWREDNPALTREEFAVLRLLRVSLGRGRDHRPLGTVVAFDDDFSAIHDFAMRFCGQDATVRTARAAWSGTLLRLYRAGVLDRVRQNNQRAAIGDGFPPHSYRYSIGCDADYLYWWEHPESIQEHLDRLLPAKRAS